MRKTFLLSTFCFSKCIASSLVISGAPAPLVISSAIAGEEPTAAIDTSSSLSCQGKSPLAITVQLQEPLSKNTYLYLQAENLGPKVSLSLSPQYLFFKPLKQNDLTALLSYEYVAKAKSGTLAHKTTTVLFTLLDTAP